MAHVRRHGAMAYVAPAAIELTGMADRLLAGRGPAAPLATFSGKDSMAKNRNTFEKTQRENAKRRKAEEKRAARRRKKDEPATPAARPAADDVAESTAE
jgi:hypothetical protein